MSYSCIGVEVLCDLFIYHYSTYNFLYISCTSLITFCGIPVFCIALQIPLCHTLSNAHLKSMRLNTFWLCSMLFSSICVIVNCASSQPGPDLFFSKCSVNIVVHSALYHFGENFPGMLCRPISLSVLPIFFSFVQIRIQILSSLLIFLPLFESL